MNERIMPKMPDFKNVELEKKIDEKCRLVSQFGKCPGDEFISCGICVLESVNTYLEWKNKKAKKTETETTIIKWPMNDKEAFFILPRVQMNDMPDDWKKRAEELLNEFSASNSDLVQLTVSARLNNKYVKMPKWYNDFNK